MMILAIAIITAYLLGAIPASYLIAKAFKGVDIRKYGSGNVGATNVLRTAGKLPGILALIADMLKGIIVVTFVSSFFFQFSVITDYESLRILLGFVAICGHIWTIFMKFKGGKGVATTLGVLIILCPKAVGIGAIVWFITVLITKYVSLGSILMSVSLPISVAIMGSSIKMVIFTITLCIINTYKHRANIIRLINNEESRIGQKVL